MQIYVHRNNQQLGPFTDAEVRAKLASGELSLQDHAWWDGQAGWKPLAQTPFGGMVPGTAAAAHYLPPAAPTSSLAIASLVCGCLSLLCWFLTAIPAVIMGHMSLSQIKKNPAIQGKGMAIAGLILGYVMTAISVLYILLMVVLFTLGNNVQETFKTIEAQVNETQSSQQDKGDDDDSSTNKDNGTNAAPTTP